MATAILPDGVGVNRFLGANGCEEIFLALEPPRGTAPDFAAQLAAVEANYVGALAALGLGAETAVFRRLFLSDALNQAAEAEASALADNDADSPVAVSIVQQPPLGDGKLALLAYHLRAPERLIKRRHSPHHVLVQRGGARHLWSTRLCAGARSAPPDAAAQTRLAFDKLMGALAAYDADLERCCQRTWIYLKDVDLFYGDMVRARTDLFERCGLTADTHYIASTGIEGACAHQYDVVAMDAYSHLDLTPGQVSYLNDFESMCATKDYAVTFERGTRLSYADRRHYYISGTASIDKAGQVWRRGDVLAQLDRALENIDAILRSGEAGLADLSYLIVYLRDRSDHAAVRARLAARLPGLPAVYVQGPVCRPEWLIELEGVAVTANDQPELPGF
jgi:enamine deaminase RidA (YjgF/YER057c/UK114 family)